MNEDHTKVVHVHVPISCAFASHILLLLLLHPQLFLVEYICTKVGSIAEDDFFKVVYSPL